MNPQKSSSFSSNASPAWGSPALRPNASFPPSPVINTPPNQHRSPRHPGNRQFSAGQIYGSPQFQGMGFQGSFRTPQPHPCHQSPNSPRGSWSDGKGNRGRPYQRQSWNGSQQFQQQQNGYHTSPLTSTPSPQGPYHTTNNNGKRPFADVSQGHNRQWSQGTSWNGSPQSQQKSNGYNTSHVASSSTPFSHKNGKKPRYGSTQFDGRHGSPRHSPNVNPGGSDNIRLYCSPSMLEDPWIDCPPMPLDYWKK